VTSPYPAPATAPALLPGPETSGGQPALSSSPVPSPYPAPAAPPVPAVTPAPVYAPAPVVGPPPAAPDAVVQPPPAAWDPYATPGGAPGTLLPQDPYLPCTPGIGVTSMQKFLQHIDLDFDWFARSGNNGLGITDVNLSATFAFPLWTIKTPFLVSPGFAVHYWDGPESHAPPPAPADMPPQTFDAYLDTAWNPWITEYFGAELDARIGIYSDFYSVTSDSLRFTGKGVAVVRLSPHTTLKAGLWYLNRVDVKLLPVGGIVWQPNPDVYFDILFPNPKFARRLNTWGNAEWWLYLRAEYGGGVWTIRRNPDFYNNVIFPSMSHDLVDYDDIRIAVGLDFKTIRQLAGHIEVGLACDRQLHYASGMPGTFNANSTVFIGAGLSY
jgi:hypothetical protein